MGDNADTHADFEARLKGLWLRGRDGDEQAYAQALRLLVARLRSWYMRRLGDRPDDVEDLLQETLLALHLQRGTWLAEVPVTAWAHAIARHKLVDLWRRHGRTDALHEPLEALDAAGHAAPESAGPARRDLLKLMDALPHKQQRAIALTKLQGLSVAEAATESGDSEANIKVLVHRGLKRLADMVRQERDAANGAARKGQTPDEDR
ncbi:MAG: sigma-70 family RNA polymerase sigma factor [Aquabacterium sp.]